MKIRNSIVYFTLKSTIAPWIYINLCYSHRYETGTKR